MNFFEFIERHKFSILGTIVIHIIIFVWMNLQLVQSRPYVANERVVMRLDFTEEEDETTEDEESLAATEQLNGSSPLTNVVANANQEKTTYTNQSFSKSKADQEVLDELKKLEAEEFNSIKHEQEDETTNNSSRTVDPGLVKEDAESNENASYGNDVRATANYFLPNRTPQHQPTPSYKCTAEGIVTLKIKVNQKGRVASLAIDETKTNTQNECLRNEALKYAKKWRFTQDFNDVAKKSGWIKFTYVSQ
ncbi:MAG: energy transducer TonB [Flavobacteriales bacterium]|nr:energy transducer TonB [Flavobacteriales bacterium]